MAGSRRASRDTSARVSRIRQRGGAEAELGPLARLRAEPARAAILTDVDGTLAPIVDRPEEAAVPARAQRAARRAERALRPGRLRLRAPGRGGAAAGRGRGHRLRGQPRPRAAAAGRRGAPLRPLAARAASTTRRRSSPSSGTRRWPRPGCGSRTRGRSRRCTGAAPRTSAAAEARRPRDRRGGGRAGLELRWGRKVLELRPAGRRRQGRSGGGAARRRRGRRAARLRRRRPHRPRRLPAPARAARGRRAGGRRLRRHRLRRGAAGAGRGGRPARRRPGRLAGAARGAGG